MYVSDSALTAIPNVDVAASTANDPASAIAQSATTEDFGAAMEVAAPPYQSRATPSIVGTYDVERNQLSGRLRAIGYFAGVAGRALSIAAARASTRLDSTSRFSFFSSAA